MASLLAKCVYHVVMNAFVYGVKEDDFVPDEDMHHAARVIAYMNLRGWYLHFQGDPDRTEHVRFSHKPLVEDGTGAWYSGKNAPEIVSRAALGAIREFVVSWDEKYAEAKNLHRELLEKYDVVVVIEQMGTAEGE